MSATEATKIIKAKLINSFNVHSDNNSDFKYDKWKLFQDELNWTNNEHIFFVKMMLKTFEDSSTFNTSILKILMNKGEEKLAWVLIAGYEVKIDIKILEKAINSDMFDVLKTIFIHSKNINKDTNQVYTFECIIDKIKKSGCEVHRKIEEIWKWKMQSVENFLKVLLEKSWDHLAIKYAYSFQEDAGSKLLEFCIINENEDFLRYALNEQIFKQKVIDSPEITSMIIQMLESKMWCNIVINILLYSDFHSWGKENLSKLMLLFQRIEHAKSEDNLILMLHNPILSLSIICDILVKLGKTSANFKVPAKLLSEKLQNICLKLSQLLREDLIEKVYTELDFKERSILRLATDNGLEPVIKSLKVEELIETLWTGKESFECDGRISWYSKLFYINETNLRFLNGKTFTIKDLISQNFRVQTEDEKFWYQFAFRRHSIEFIFSKEILSAFIITVVIQIVNLNYLLSWNREVMTTMTQDQMYDFIASDLDGKLII